MARLTKKKIIVTGGAGFIGSHLVDALVLSGNRVVVIDNLSSGKKEHINTKAVFYKADVKEVKKIHEIFAKEKPQVVFHFAAYPIVEKAYENPLETFRTNIMGTVHVLEACRALKNIEKVVVCSSDKAYGKSKMLPYAENHPLQGDHPYDVSKSSADLIAKTYHTTYGLPIFITRFSNVFGPRDVNESRIIPSIINSVHKAKPLMLRSNGKMVREYTYVGDIVNGCVALASHNKNFGEAFNFGSNNVFSVLDMVKKAEEALDKKIPYQILNVTKNEIPEQYLDWSKAKKVLRWQPVVPFVIGIKKTFDWFMLPK